MAAFVIDAGDGVVNLRAFGDEVAVDGGDGCAERQAQELTQVQ